MAEPILNHHKNPDQLQWKGINHKQSTRWQHLSRLKFVLELGGERYFRWQPLSKSLVAA